MLQVEWTDREQAALWANELVRRLNAEMRQRALAKADASVGYLEKELSGTTAVASREAIGRLIEAQINQRMLANVQHEYAFRVVDKAMPPDARDFVRPKRLLMLVVGALTGCILSVMCVLLVGAIKQRNVD
jgi:LPS O-antigen subunit length determinant protein (WzzB/FepE family)